MDKKAVTTGGIVVIILGLIVILLIVAGPLRVGYEYAKEKFFGEDGIFSPLKVSTEEKFVPYAGVLSSEEKIIDDSVKAFICAVNSLALNKPAWLEKDGCPGGFDTNKAECAGVSYGQSCVECYTSEFGMKTVELSESEYSAKEQLVDEVIDCWNKFEGNDKQNVYCSKVSVPEGEWSIEMTEFRNALNSRPGLGDDLAGYSLGITRNSQNFDWRIPDPLRPIVGYDFYICADVGDTFGDADEIFLTHDLGDCPVENAPPEKEFKCDVSDFELPQEIAFEKGSLYDWAFGFINKFKDPDYVFYYESFPKGEDAAWHLSPIAPMFEVVAFGSAVNVAFVGAGALFKGAKSIYKGVKSIPGRAFNRIFKSQSRQLVAGKGANALLSTAGKAGKELSELTIRELSESLTKEGYERLLRSERLFNELSEKLGSQITGASEPVSRIAHKQFKLYKSLGRSDDEIVELIAKDIVDDIGSDAFAKGELALVRESVESFVKAPLSAAKKLSLQRQQAVRNFFANYLVKESGDILEREAIENVLEKAFSKEIIGELKEEAAGEFVLHSMRYADEIVDVSKPAANLKLQRIFGSPKAVVAKQFKSEFDSIADSLYNANKDTFMKFFAGVSRAELKESAELAAKEAAEAAAKKAVKKGATKEAAEEIAEKIASQHYRAFVKKTAKNYIPIKFKRSYFNIPRPVLLRSLAGVPETAGRTAYAAWRSPVARYSLAYVIATLMTEADARNDKYSYYGENTLVVQQPYLLEKNKKYDLHERMSDYYLNLFKFKGASSRFFLASPCRADLFITKTDCSCLVDNGEFLLNRKGEYQLFDPSSVVFEKGSINPVFRFDELYEGNQKVLIDTTFASVQDQAGRFSGFNKQVLNVIVSDPEIAGGFIEFLYKHAYLPVFDYVDEDLADSFDSKIRSGSTVNNIFRNYYVHHPTVYVMDFWKDAFGAWSIFDLFVDGEGDYKAMASFRRNPLSLDEFTKEFYAGFYYGTGSGLAAEAVKNIVYRLRSLSSYSGYSWQDMKDSFWNEAVRHAYLNYVIVDSAKVNDSKIAKVCEAGIIGRESDLADSSNVFETGVSFSRLSVPCFNVEVARDSDIGYNFCYSGDHSALNNVKYALLFGAAAIDLIVAVSPAGLLGEIPVTILTGAVAAYGAEQIDRSRYWPNP